MFSFTLNLISTYFTLMFYYARRRQHSEKS